MKIKGKKILITGADGFIGSHLTEELIRSGADVRAFVFYNSFNSWGWLDHSPKEIKETTAVIPIKIPSKVNQERIPLCLRFLNARVKKSEIIFYNPIPPFF